MSEPTSNPTADSANTKKGFHNNNNNSVRGRGRGGRGRGRGRSNTRGGGRGRGNNNSGRGRGNRRHHYNDNNNNNASMGQDVGVSEESSFGIIPSTSASSNFQATTTESQQHSMVSPSLGDNNESNSNHYTTTTDCFPADASSSSSGNPSNRRGGRGGRGRGGRNNRGRGRGRGRNSRRPQAPKSYDQDNTNGPTTNTQEGFQIDSLEGDGNVHNASIVGDMNVFDGEHRSTTNITEQQQMNSPNYNFDENEEKILQKRLQEVTIFENNHIAVREEEEEEKKSEAFTNADTIHPYPSNNNNDNGTNEFITNGTTVPQILSKGGSGRGDPNPKQRSNNSTRKKKKNVGRRGKSKMDTTTNIEEGSQDVDQNHLNLDAVSDLSSTGVVLPLDSTAANSMNRIDSVASLSRMSDKSNTEKDANAGTAGVIDLLKHKRNEKSTSTTAKKKKRTKKSKSEKNNHKNGKHDNNQLNDEMKEKRAARKFNSSVRNLVERSDPDGLYDILHDKHNHKYALDADVLETVMKAFVVAAMFEDALFCLRHCTLPGTLSCLQIERILQCLPQNLRNSSAYVAADMIDALCIATEFDKPRHRTYFLRIIRGIALEFLEEATSARDRICSAPCERLVRNAICVVDARLQRGKKATDLVVQPGNQLGVFVPDTMENRGIQAGDAVGILPYAGPYPMSAESLDRNMIEATVTGTQPLIIRLQDKTNASLHAMLTEPAEGNVYRIDKLANRMGFNRQLTAAVAIAAPMEKDPYGANVQTKSDTRRPSPELIKAITAMDENIDKAMILDDNAAQQQRLGGQLTSTAALCSQPVPWSACDEDFEGRQDEDAIRDMARLALEKYGAFENLNSSQQLAVEGAASNRLTLVQGPPGTGKTAVAIRIIQHWARLASGEAGYGESPKPILATSDSNIAVDNLVEGCANVGLRVIRLGRPEAIRPELLRYCIDRPQSNGNGSGFGNGQNYASVFKEKIKSLKNAQVVCCTCIGSGADILDNMTFERVLVDEATQATEPAVLVPLTRMCRQLVLVGDHCQLPPTVLSTRAEEEGLGVPLFSRMVACGVPPFMLDTQYRMHPGIAMFPSDLFYGGKLLNGVSPPERRPLAGFPWPREEFPIAFVPVPHGIEMDDGVSKMNEAEAAAACDAVAALLAGGQCSSSDIAVVTPYAAQVRLIRRLTRKLVSGPPYVEVSSTDGFQGREKEAVIFSAVRSNDYGTVGFVSDWRRVNVSFTRARRGLVVIGNDVTLRRGDPETWMPWLAWADAHGINMDKPGIPRGRYDAEQLRRVRGGTTAAEMLKDVLERQQAQRKTAEKQLEKAEKKSSGHISGGGVGALKVTNGTGLHTGSALNGTHVINDSDNLEQDLALLSNADGCWDDDSDDEDHCEIQHSVSVNTFTTTSSSSKVDEGSQDIWDTE